MRRRESEYCLKAARASAAGYDFRRAKNYLEMAEECAELSAAGPLVEIGEAGHPLPGSPGGVSGPGAGRRRRQPDWRT